MVYYREDCIIATAFGQLRDKVHCYYLEWEHVDWHWDFERRRSYGVQPYLILLTGGATFHVLGNPCLEGWPPERLFYFLDGPVSPWVSFGWEVVMSLSD